MKKRYCLAVLWFLAADVFAQSTVVSDSLERELRLPHPDSVQVAILNKLASQYMRFDMGKAQEKLTLSAALTAQMSQRWSDESSFLRYRANTQLTYGNLLFRQGKYHESLKYYFETLRCCDQVKDQLSKGKALIGIGSAYYYLEDLENAYLYFKQAEPIFEKLRFMSGLLSVKSNISAILDRQNRKQEANEAFKSVGEIAESLGMWEIAGGAWQNAMNYYLDTDDLGNAAIYAERARFVIEKTNDKLNLGLLLAKISYIQLKKEDYAAFRNSSQQVLDIGLQLKNNLLVRTGCINLASGYLKAATLATEPALKDSFYNKAVSLLETSLSVTDSIYNAEKANAITEMRVKYETEKKEREISDLNAEAKNNQIKALQREIELRQEKLNTERARQESILMEKINQNINLDLEVKEARLQEQNALSEQSRKDIELLQIKNARQDADARNERQLRYGLLLGLLALAVFSFLLYRNIRHRMLAQRKIEQQRAEIAAKNASLEAANNYKSIFLSNMSHEIRTPLNSIIGMSDLLHDTELTPRQREFASVVRHASENLLAIINEILDFSKIEAGKMELRPQAFDLRELIVRQIQLLNPQAEQKQIELLLQLDANLPQFVIADPTRLNQILLNLLSNAVKFTEKGSVTLHATVQERFADETLRLRFAVRDTGIGIPPEQLKIVFDPFVQAGDDTHLRHNGTGLGLAIAKQLVELQGGEIKAESILGKGSEFSFSLKVQETQTAPAPEPKLESVQMEQLDVLLVEDNLFNQMLATELLQKLIKNPRIQIASNGQEAVEAAINSRFDLVLMDVKMPVMDGFAATKAIRALNIATPIIALTANATAEERTKCLSSGMDDYVSKPISIGLLEEKIRRWTVGREG